MLQALPPEFAGLEPADVQEASGLLQPLRLDAGELIMEQGESDTTLGFIMKGTVAIADDDVRIGGAGARDVLGLPELFTGVPRMASVTAATPVDLLVLPPEGFRVLCERGNPAVYNLERAALRKMSERLRYFNENISELTRGKEFSLHPNEGLFHRLQKTFRGNKVPEVDAAAVLAASPMFDWADGSIVQSISEGFTVEAYEAEHIICRQGEPADKMWVIAEGSVEVVVMVGDDRAQQMAVLTSGGAFGDASMAAGTPRSASVACHEDVVVLALDRAHYLELHAVDDPVGSTFRQAMCRNLVFQLQAAQRAYAKLSRMRHLPEEQMLRGTPLNSVWRD